MERVKNPTKPSDKLRMNNLFAWNPAYTVGCAEIDQQHQQLFAMAGDLHKAMMERRGKEVLADLLKRLVAYTKYHFSTEERRMQESGYPHYMQHRTEHVKLTQQVIEFEEKVRKGEAAVSIEILKFLSDWLTHHIQRSDQKLASHLGK
jgi:hemerythrin